MKYLIVNADDFGYSKRRDEGIVQCYRKGGISSASLMVNGVSAESGVMLAKQHELPLGLHVNLSEGKPIGQIGYKTLLGEDGCFLGMFEFRSAVLEGIIDITEVRTEIECQIEKFKELVGEVPTHVDGHQHCHILPGISETFAAILKEKGVRASRIPNEDLDDDHQWSTPDFAKSMAEVVQHAREARPVFTAADIWTTEKFLGLTTMGEEILGTGSSMTFEKLTRQLTQVFHLEKPTNNTSDKQKKNMVTCELMTHPGYQTGEVGGCGNGPDDFSQSLDREREMSVLVDKRFSQFYQSSNISLVSFKECLKNTTDNR